MVDLSCGVRLLGKQHELRASKHICRKVRTTPDESLDETYSAPLGRPSGSASKMQS